MTERELIERLDARLEHVDTHMARADRVFEEIRALIDEIREQMRLSREEHQDHRAFIREQTTLMQRTGRAIEERGARSDRKVDAILARLDDMGDQIRANTEATWRMLDRLSGNGGAAPATG